MDQQEDSLSKDTILQSTFEELNLEGIEEDDDVSNTAPCYEAGTSKESSPPSFRKSFVGMQFDGPSCSKADTSFEMKFDDDVSNTAPCYEAGSLKESSPPSFRKSFAGMQFDGPSCSKADTSFERQVKMRNLQSFLQNDNSSSNDDPSSSSLLDQAPSSTNLFYGNVNRSHFDDTASASSWEDISDSEVFDPSDFLGEFPPSTLSLEDSESAYAMPKNVQINADEIFNNSNDHSLGENVPSSSLDNSASSSNTSASSSNTSVVEEPAKSCHDNSSVLSVEDMFNGPNNIRATEKEIGFLGIGEMGSVLVNNLLKSGHIITVWNRTPEKYRDFLMDGAEEAKFPCEVIKKCDIIFCCLSDEIAVKEVVEGKNGVLEGFEECKDNKTGKGFVQLTTLDPSMSKNHSESISKLGGKYLEAVMMGTKELAKNLAMMYICAGHVGLFEDCYTCFAATSREAFFLKEKVGKACQMKIVVGMVRAATTGTIQEVIELITRRNMSLDPLINFLLKGPLQCPLITKRTMELLNNKPDTEFKSRQRDLHLATTTLSNKDFPLRMAAAVKEFDLRNNAKKHDADNKKK